jgi:hypothetical protein
MCTVFVHSAIYCCQISIRLKFPELIFEKRIQALNYTEIPPVRAQLLRTDRETLGKVI